MVFHEERVFRESFSAAIELMPPPAPIKEEIEGEQEYFAAIRDHEQAYGEYRAMLDAKIEEAIEAQEFPPGVVGLIPDGDRRVEWRWRGPVFEESTEDILNNSIVGAQPAGAGGQFDRGPAAPLPQQNRRGEVRYA
jgi:hypothetical protein